MRACPRVIGNDKFWFWLRLRLTSDLGRDWAFPDRGMISPPTFTAADRVAASCYRLVCTQVANRYWHSVVDLCSSNFRLLISAAGEQDPAPVRFTSGRFFPARVIFGCRPPVCRGNMARSR